MMFNVLVVFFVVIVVFYFMEVGEWWEVIVQWMMFEVGEQYFGQFFDICFVIWVVDVNDLFVVVVVFVFDDVEQCFDIVVDVGEVVFLFVVFDKFDW